MRLTKTLLLAVVLSAACADSQPQTFGDGAGKADGLGGDWETRVARDVFELKRNDPALYKKLTTVEGRATRLGTLRLRSGLVHHKVSASVFIHRYMEERTVENRIAFVEALPRTGGVFVDAISALMDSETDADVRAAMVASLGRQDEQRAIDGIDKGLRDPSAKVRTEAAVAAFSNKRGGDLAKPLRAALNDDSAQVRAASARALGIHRILEAAPELSLHLNDSDASVRLGALRALVRLDAAGASKLPELARLQGDSDARVRRVAVKAQAMKL